MWVWEEILSNLAVSGEHAVFLNRTKLDMTGLLAIIQPSHSDTVYVYVRVKGSMFVCVSGSLATTAVNY